MTHLDKVPDDKQVELVTAMTDRLNQIISKGGKLMSIYSEQLNLNQIVSKGDKLMSIYSEPTKSKLDRK